MRKRQSASQVLKIAPLSLRGRALQRGQGLTEYALMVTLIAVGAIAAVTYFGGRVTSKMSSAASELGNSQAEEVPGDHPRRGANGANGAKPGNAK